ncbi:serine/threonine-protein phosphatase 2A regulatory subunit B'' subunit gamma-like isoform X2 [Ctenocephalides felis]|uniref:serine/threonine-protein phosphatase 2A regulatory subunit B'' subunit gamma-like isoform X2 n=1 Tax=Ctenocephalides felis TaxID=7515 RepID=UPI000E6E33B8|nr:serine/threonine-protein phosphatase 2A regulatory subunit B'' subunit gamma-like isoform X2 [Ctenocephalides felis]
MDIKEIFKKKISRYKELSVNDPEQNKECSQTLEENTFNLCYDKCKLKLSKEDSSAYQKIPKFYKIMCDDYKSSDLIKKFNEESRSLFIQEKSSLVLNNNELKSLYGLLEKYHTRNCGEEQFINYEGYCRVMELADKRARHYLTISSFVQLQEDDLPGFVNIMTLFNHIMRLVWLRQSRIGLNFYDVSGQGSLYEAELEAYIQELIPTLPQLKGLENPLRTGRVLIDNILASNFLEELLELRDNNLPKESQDTNWFSAPSALQVYGHYLKLDRDHNGMLSKDELSSYGSGTLTSAFLDRVFQECMTYQGEMDYKTYLDFVLAMENRHEPQSLQYFFKILDIDSQKYLTGFTLNYFFKSIQEQMQAHGAEPVLFENIKDEIFDMVKPEDPTRITLKDIINSQQGDTLVSILIELHGFLAYENRELVITDTPKEESMQV